jgi:hypothetical protein
MHLLFFKQNNLISRQVLILLGLFIQERSRKVFARRTALDRWIATEWLVLEGRLSRVWATRLPNSLKKIWLLMTDNRPSVLFYYSWCTEVVTVAPRTLFRPCQFFSRSCSFCSSGSIGCWLGDMMMTKFINEFETMQSDQMDVLFQLQSAGIRKWTARTSIFVNRVLAGKLLLLFSC